MTYIKLGGVLAFPGAVPDKAQALKVLEEAAEVVEAFKRADPGDVLPVARQFPDCNKRILPLVDEIADTIQASCNLAAALGVTDLTPYLARCEERNRERGRYGD
ncbi:hypothetical protein [Collinsella stercoris]|uniref:hypothetical protein n=1 Tax=Collinsella stercoris TaxID=147206 RepID=UPI00248EAC80|nr:hypothetical protein [Collinsella stercoris]